MNPLIQHLLDGANAVAFTAFGAPTTWGEVIGFATGLVGVWLVAKNHLLNWPVGIISSAYYLLVFWTAHLFADSMLQIIYIVLGIIGWWSWAHGGRDRTALPITRTTRAQWAALAAIGVPATVAMALYLHHATDSTVYWFDAATTVVSLLATWGQTRRKIESWWLWIAVDLVYIPLYQVKHLTLTALLYGGFLALCVLGLVEWRRLLGAQGGSDAGPAAADSVETDANAETDADADADADAASLPVAASRDGRA